MFNANITGKIGKVEEPRNIGDNKVKNFTLAHNYKRGEEWATVWYECALWGSRAESLDLGPGDTVSISTSQAIVANGYLDKEDNPTASLKVTVDQIHVTKKPKEG